VPEARLTVLSDQFEPIFETRGWTGFRRRAGRDNREELPRI